VLTRAPAAIAALAAIASLSACGPTTVVEIAPPLTIVDTFPGHGALLPGTDVTHVDVVFSEPVAGATALAALRLESVDASDELEDRYTLLADPERGDDGFDAELLTLSATIGDPSPDGALPDGARYRLTITAGLTAVGGSVLPVDVVRRFATDSR